jgi:hypothetical protein
MEIFNRLRQRKALELGLRSFAQTGNTPSGAFHYCVGISGALKGVQQMLWRPVWHLCAQLIKNQEKAFLVANTVRRSKAFKMMGSICSSESYTLLGVPLWKICAINSGFADPSR